MPRKSKSEKRQSDTERVAWELYQNRVLLGRAGDEHSDWKEAEDIIRSPIRTALLASKHHLIKLRQPTQQVFKFLTWDTPRWLIFSLPQLEWMKLLAVPLVIAAAGSIITGRIQREANQNAVLKAYFDKLEELTFAQNLLAETPNSGAIVLARGRTVAALRELDLSRRTQLIDFLQASALLTVDLSKIEDLSAAPVISFKWQNLSGLDLRQMNLSGLDLQEVNLERSNLKGAFLDSANLKGAFLERSNLERAFLYNANLEEAKLYNTNLTGANLDSANLKGAFLYDANLTGANLNSADLKGASLGDAHLVGANLSSADLTGAFLYSATLTQDQLKLAKLCFTTLPQHIDLDPNRDCKELDIDPETGEPIGP